LDSLLRNFRPSGSWRNWFAEAYGQALESSTASEQLKGWATAATIFGDMHACVLCLFVCYHGLELGSEARERFLGHINLCLMDMGLATPAKAGPVPMKELSSPEHFTWMSRPSRRGCTISCGRSPTTCAGLPSSA